MNIKKSYRLLHQTLNSSCGNFYYVDALHTGKDSEIILGASCARCKLLKVKILDNLGMQDMVDFLTYEICQPVIPRGIISDRGANLIGQDVKDRISSLNQGLNRFKFYNFMNESYEEGAERDLDAEHKRESERWRKEVLERKENTTKDAAFRQGVELQKMLKMAAESRQQKYKPTQADDIRRRIGRGEREAEIPPQFTLYTPPPYSSNMMTGVERLWQTIGNIVKKLMSQHDLNWREVFKIAVSLYNAAAVSYTHLTLPTKRIV